VTHSPGSVVALGLDVPADAMQALPWLHRNTLGSVLRRERYHGRERALVQFAGAPSPMWVWGGDLRRVA
jgi:hypothetical protein